MRAFEDRVRVPAPGPWNVLSPRGSALDNRNIGTRPYSEIRDPHGRIIGHVSNQWFDSAATRRCVEAAPRFYRAFLWMLEAPGIPEQVRAHLRKVVEDAGLAVGSYKEVPWRE
jgi:hypothetical protein